MGLRDWGKSLKKIWDRTLDTTDATVDTAKHPESWANDLQTRAFKDKLALSESSFDSIFVHEMLDGTADKPEGTTTGAAILRKLEIFLVKVQADITAKTVRGDVADILTHINAVLNPNPAEAEVDNFKSIIAIADSLNTLQTEEAFLKALKDSDKQNNFDTLMAAWNYEERAQAITSKANFKDFFTFAASDSVAEIFNLGQGQQQAILRAKEADPVTALKATKQTLEFLNNKVEHIYVVEAEQEALKTATSLVGSYNLSMTVPKDTASLTKHYGGQALSSTIDYTGKTVESVGKGWKWFKNRYFRP